MKAIIITPYLHAPIRSLADIATYDLILCADSAYLLAEREGITPDTVIGDFDHGKRVHPDKDAKNVVTVPCEKDDTDTMLCLKHAIDRGADEITILGGIGGRLDHTFANIQSLAYAARHGVRARLLSERDEVFLVHDRALIHKPVETSYLSVFAYDGICTGVTEIGTKYEIRDAVLDTSFPLGVSNEIVAEQAEIRVKTGRLLIILSKKD
ncbi:MAG: thiamine diphosphokinase [Clostridia bacterium]|nr:thiamine diphosphokinase [Clostridia bacterium]